MYSKSRNRLGTSVFETGRKRHCSFLKGQSRAAKRDCVDCSTINKDPLSAALATRDENKFVNIIEDYAQ